MTVPFRTPLTGKDRYLYPNIVKATLVRMGVISYADTPTDAMYEICYDIMLDTAIQLVNSGTIGSFKTRPIKPDESKYDAKPWDHIFIEADNPLGHITLPVVYQDIKQTKRYSKDMDCIKVTNQRDGNYMIFLFDGNRKLWLNVNQPIFDVDVVPFSTVDREGYIADLYIKLSDIFAIENIPQAISDAQDRWYQQIQLRAGNERDDEVSYLFGTTSDPDYVDPYNLTVFLDYGFPGNIGPL